MIRWEQQPDGNWQGFSGEVAVATVTATMKKPTGGFGRLPHSSGRRAGAKAQATARAG